ncbi:SMI1/KNR4 family protein [Streptomyces flaveolus]|uniref:SMI1/KNR4 family protein n=1 Tax=Streptomyces flaveolus TaxID=67297 RepID=UPI0037FAE54E
MTADFERRHGFPPGTNEILTASSDDRAAARALVGADRIPADLATFYDSIGSLVWADVGNGFFLDSAGEVLRGLQEYGTVDVGTDQKVPGLVIGSNGGGLSYTAGLDGTVHRTRTASLDEPELDQVASELRQFLELLEESLTRFTTDGELGPL